MAKQISIDSVIQGFKAGFEETFEKVQGIYLDRGTSLFETLETITAEQASRPVSDRCATIAAHVAHINFYLEVLENIMHKKKRESVDWGEIWRTVSAVTPEEWEASKATLKTTYQRIIADIQDTELWEDDHEISCVFGMIIHSAYHLGEIRQALCYIGN